MSAETAQTVLVDVKAAGMSGEKQSEAAVAALRERIRIQYETQSDPYYATSRLWDDGIIEPKDTRDVLGICLALVTKGPREQRRFRVFRM
jgi:3-methylcrotonyl-CoA carboxylase beta subunit